MRSIGYKPTMPRLTLVALLMLILPAVSAQTLDASLLSQRLRSNLPFPGWDDRVRHDDHVHIDFKAQCR